MLAMAIYLCLVLLLSGVCLVAYGIDKRRAGAGERRISEFTLQALALFGGWPGALVGQRLFRHKTRKISFQLVFWLLVVLHLGLVAAVSAVYLRWFRP